ncbi:type IV pilus biogenesis/stability protein PilW [Paludibacterium paludis]|uniref:Type IV pilus biogenesis/stability protein PilW n=2 Tax=Paludibacterium paludis TaxID=1225769 RepID=A0A918NY93_9NEIS|nr:type IV pilus biogenesis/stability protein PilW [Paludibacterium paludis]
MWIGGCLAAFALDAFAADSVPDLAKIRAQLAVEYARAGSYRFALDAANEAIRIAPGYAEGWLSRAWVHSGLRMEREADADYRKALSIEPDNPAGNNNYGSFLCDHGKAAESLAYFRRAIANPLYETPALAWVNMARCHLALDRKDEANEDLLAALSARPDYPPALKALAALHLALGHVKLASFYFDRLAGNPDALGPEDLMVGIRLARLNGNRVREEALAARLKGRYPDSRQTQQLLSGT